MCAKYSESLLIVAISVADNVKWVASKLMPKVYGDRQQVDSTVTITHEDTLKDLS